MTQSPNTQPRMLTLKELGALIQGYRKLRQWSEQELAERANLTLSQILEVESEQSNDPQTLRALALAFSFGDADVFNKPILIPTNEEFDAQAESHERAQEGENLEAFVLLSGQELGKLVEQSSTLAVNRSFELGHQGDMVFEALTDYLREYRQCMDDYTAARIADIHEEFQEYLDELKTLGISISYASRDVASDSPTDEPEDRTPARVLYLIAFPVGEEPESFLV